MQPDLYYNLGNNILPKLSQSRNSDEPAITQNLTCNLTFDPDLCVSDRKIIRILPLSIMYLCMKSE